MPKIQYTKTDEAPFLATHSFLPIVKAFTKSSGVEFVLKDISLAGRILDQFNDILPESQRTENALEQLGAMAKTPEANIIKLPNISASIPQLKEAISELQAQGFEIPNFPEEPKSETDKNIRAKYAKVLGSAVNPVLREGNSDRRVAKPVKEYAKANPHRMGAWSKDSQSHVAHMASGDFYESEQSTVASEDTTFTIEHVNASGERTVLKGATPLLQGEILDCSFMKKSALCDYFKKEIQETKTQGVLLSLHLKATMMKVSDPIIFGHAVKTFFASVFEKHSSVFADLKVNPNNGLGDLYSKLQTLSSDVRRTIETDLSACLEQGPELAMVNSDKGITNLHVPSDVIIDASMPAMLKSSGKMWDTKGELKDTKALIPDRSYAGLYQAVVAFCKEHGAFDPTTMGNVSNVGLMAKKAEEYGSHDKTFEIKEAGTIEVKFADGTVVMTHEVNEGDIWRACQTKEVAVKDWVRLGVQRAKQTGSPAVFWLDSNRAHDANLIKMVKTELSAMDESGVETHILSPVEAMNFTLKRVKEGQDTISVTGNVLRDYLTDLFPILELGTSAKMLSIVPLLAGGGLYETGAGGSAPKHVDQVIAENHLRWDSLGEFLALQVSLEDLATKSKSESIQVLAEALDVANTKYLTENKAPSRKAGELDNRGSHFYLAMYWAQALAEQNKNDDLKSQFSKVAAQLEENESTIVEELNSVQGKPVDLKGYYFPDESEVARVMRPSSTFNSIVNAL